MPVMSANPRIRVLLDDAHPSSNTASFAQATLMDPGVRRALGSRARLLHVTSDEEHDKLTGRFFSRSCSATYFDYQRNQAIQVTGGPGGAGPYRIRIIDEQPFPNRAEYLDAVALIAASPTWGPLLASGSLTHYEPMPAMLEPAPGQKVERTIYVGLHSPRRNFNRIVAVNMIRREVSLEGVRPRGVRYTDENKECGVPAAQCLDATFQGRPGQLTLEWPSENPVWKMRIIRPSASAGTNSSGIELRNVSYRGHRVLSQAHVPILNVEYDGNLCGPYRDWLWREWCFTVPGADVPDAPGFRICPPGEQPLTVLDTGIDGGNHVGVAVYETADGALGLTTQCSAGWYRYIMEWFFYPDGRLLPRFRFGGVQNACVCNVHHHHAYWRLDFDILDDKNIVEELIGETWTPLAKEATRTRLPDLSPLWRVRHHKRAAAYEIIPGENDGVGDEFSGPDLYAFLFKAKGRQIDDKHRMISDAKAEILPWKNKEKILKEDVVVWYVAHFVHDVNETGPASLDDHSIAYGPTLRPVDWPT